MPTAVITTGTIIGEISMAMTMSARREIGAAEAERRERAERRRQDGGGEGDDDAVLERQRASGRLVKKSSYQRSDRPGIG